MTIGRIPSVEGGIQPTIFDAKADLLTATANDTPARLAVGSNDQVLVADSAASTGLAWKSYGAQFAAGKNKIINGDFYINQRAFSSITCSGSPQYGFDRFSATSNTGTVTMSAQTFTPGTAPVAGYEAKNFVRIDSTGQSGTSAYSIFYQPIEDVRTFANQTITVSFWAKASSGTPSIALEIAQGFGSGGSPSAQVNTAGGKVAITTSWARYSFTVAVPSISGKTIGTTHPGNTSINFWTSAGTDFNTRASSLGIQTATIDFWGVQAEAGSVATAFQTATGTLAGELVACQRYYQRFSIDTDGHTGFIGNAYLTTASSVTRGSLVSMRTTPSSVDYSNVNLYDGVTFYAITGLTIWAATENHTFALLATGATGLTQYRSYFLVSSGAAGFVALSAEL
jgi:hypothetical protein